MVRKGLVVGIVFLFIGVAVAPSINFTVVKASNDNDLVEVTTQACGINGFGNTTVKLTREQYQNLEQYLVEFRARLNQTTTREEAVPLFKEAVVELNTYGLLPKGMSVERAQQLVTGQHQQRIYERLINTPFLRNQMDDSNTTNYLCLVYSAVNGLRAINGSSSVLSIGPIVRLTNNVFYLLFYSPGFANSILKFFENHHNVILSKIFTFALLPFVVFSIPVMWEAPLITTLNPINILYTICLGTNLSDMNLSHHNDYIYDPAIGWVATFGLNGKRIFQNQPLWGNLPVIPEIPPFDRAKYYPGVTGFTGLHIFPMKETSYFLGSALWVKIGSEPPENTTA